jgi:hypothetical protein
MALQLLDFILTNDDEWVRRDQVVRAEWDGDEETYRLFNAEGYSLGLTDSDDLHNNTSQVLPAVAGTEVTSLRVRNWQDYQVAPSTKFIMQFTQPVIAWRVVGLSAEPITPNYGAMHLLKSGDRWLAVPGHAVFDSIEAAKRSIVRKYINTRQRAEREVNEHTCDRCC